MLKFLKFLFFCCVPVCNGFLLNNNTLHSGGNPSLSDTHYLYLMDQIGQQRQNQKTMEQFVLQLQDEVKSLKLQQIDNNRSRSLQGQEIEHLKAVSMTLKEEMNNLEKKVTQVIAYNIALRVSNQQLSNEMSTLANETSDLRKVVENLRNLTPCDNGIKDYINETSAFNETVNQLQHKYEMLNYTNSLNQQDITKLKFDIRGLSQDNVSLKKEILSCRNETLKVRKESHALTDYLNHKIDRTNKKVDSISSISNSSSHKYVLLYNKTTSIQKKIVDLENENKKSFSDLMFLMQTQNRTSDDVFKKIAAINQTVALTSCSEHGPVQPGSYVRFPYIKTTYGMNHTNIETFRNTGVFTCQVSGIYLLSVFILNSQAEGQFAMYKNDELLAIVEPAHVASESFSSFHTGTGVVSVILISGDTLSVKAYFNNLYVISEDSCLTILKIR